MSFLIDPNDNAVVAKCKLCGHQHMGICGNLLDIIQVTVEGSINNSNLTFVTLF